MKVQVLLSCINQVDFSILDESNIQTSAIVVNQCGKNEVNEFEYKGEKIKFISLASKGVGISRNTALINADENIVLFADDDVHYYDGYEDLIVQEFEKHPEADMICFNFKYLNQMRPGVYTDKFKRVSWMNCMRYGTYKMAVKRDKIMKNRIAFSLLFGGGSRFGSGEDSFFISDCIKSGMKVFASPVCLGTVEQKESTWFFGYNEKYYRDKGAFWAAYGKKLWPFYSIYYLIKNQKQIMKSEFSLFRAFQLMAQGAEEYRNPLKSEM